MKELHLCVEDEGRQDLLEVVKGPITIPQFPRPLKAMSIISMYYNDEMTGPTIHLPQTALQNHFTLPEYSIRICGNPNRSEAECSKLCQPRSLYIICFTRLVSFGL